VRTFQLVNAITKSLAGDDMESEGDRVAFLKKCETIIEEIEIDMQAAKELSFEPAGVDKKQPKTGEKTC